MKTYAVLHLIKILIQTLGKLPFLFIQFVSQMKDNIVQVAGGSLSGYSPHLVRLSRQLTVNMQNHISS